MHRITKLATLVIVAATVALLTSCAPVATQKMDSQLLEERRMGWQRIEGPRGVVGSATPMAMFDRATLDAQKGMKEPVKWQAKAAQQVVHFVEASPAQIMEQGVRFIFLSYYTTTGMRYSEVRGARETGAGLELWRKPLCDDQDKVFFMTKDSCMKATASKASALLDALAETFRQSEGKGFDFMLPDGSPSPNVMATPASTATTITETPTPSAPVSAPAAATPAASTATLVASAKASDVESMRQALSNGADPSEVDEDSGNTALHYSTWNGDLDAVMALLSHGANPNAKNTKSGLTSLMNAVWQGHAAVVRTLMDKGADVNARDNRGNSAMDMARLKNRQDIVSMLQPQHKSPAATATSTPPAQPTSSATTTRDAARAGAATAVTDPASKFRLQLGMFSSRSNAEGMVKKLASAKLDAEVNELNMSGKKMYQVVLKKGFKTRDDASKERKDLKAKGKDALITESK